MNTDFMIFGIKLLNIFFPKLAYTLLKKVLLVPEIKTSQWPDKIKKVIIKTDYGKVKTYRYGQGKCIWLVHGWSDAYQLWPLMRKLANEGYNCIAIELPPHNNDSNKFISLPKWIKAFEVAAANITEPTHVIAHGLSTSVLANTRWFSSYSNDLTLISPVLDYRKSLDLFVQKNNIPKQLLGQFVKEVYTTENVRLNDLKATASINKFNGKVSIFYSQIDGISSVEAIKNISNGSNRKIVHFKGATTNKIINSKSLLCSIDVHGKSLKIAV
jgi:hypothetical protein